MMNKVTEMQKLAMILKIADIPFEVKAHPIDGSPHLLYPNAEERKCSIICFWGSYGGRDGLLEIMGLVDEEKVGDEVEGWLTGAEVARRIMNDYLGDYES